MGDLRTTTNHWDAAPGQPPEPLLSQPELLEIAAAGWAIGAHSLTHTALPTLPSGEAFAELAGSRLALEARLRRPVRSLAYPYGAHTEAVQALARKAGFRYAFVIDQQAGAVLEDAPLAIFRAYVFPHETRFSLWKKTRPWYRAHIGRKRGW
jgi:peptidoglycan/xylan/chitin deacetylase (PgdA/CDA1 family)